MMQIQQVGLKNMSLERYNNFLEWEMQSILAIVFFWCSDVCVLGPQDILRCMQVVLHIYDSLANQHMQSNLHDTQANLHNVFATLVDCQCRLQFFFVINDVFFAFACGFFVGVVGILTGASGTVKHIIPYVYSTYLRSPIKRIIVYFLLDIFKPMVYNHCPVLRVIPVNRYYLNLFT